MLLEYLDIPPSWEASVTILQQRACSLASAHLVHCHEVKRGIEAALNSGQVDVEREFIVHQCEHLVLGGARPGHEVEPRPNVGTVLMLGKELEGQGIPARRRAVGAAVVRALEGTLLGTVVACATDRRPPERVRMVCQSDCR